MLSLLSLYSLYMLGLDTLCTLFVLCLDALGLWLALHVVELFAALAKSAWMAVNLQQAILRRIAELEGMLAELERAEQEFAQRRQARLAAMDAEDSDADTVSE